jgi:hypothetical protein
MGITAQTQGELEGKVELLTSLLERCRDYLEADSIGVPEADSIIEDIGKELA